MSVTQQPAPTEARPRTRPGRTIDRGLGRLLKLPEATGDYTVRRALRVPMRDGVELLADHYAPTGPALGTLLVRGPYGRGGPFPLLFARIYAERGYHVVLQSVRGTFGSGDAFEPMRHEVDDGADTVAWLREQPWFGGRFATVGLSYLGFTQWALMTDPPPELAAALVMVGPHDFHENVHGDGSFKLNDFLGWSHAVAHQEEGGAVRILARQALAPRRLRPALAGVPLVEAGERLLAGGAPWYRHWVSISDGADPFWAPMRLDAALERVQVPVLLFGGWQDLFLEQTLAQYQRLHERGVDVALTVGPWTHNELLTKGAALTTRETLDWLAEHLAGTGTRQRPAPVHLHVTGVGEWRYLPSWPPPTTERVLHLQPGGGLGDDEPPVDAPPSTFTYDPADPTPTVGGRLLERGGYRDQKELEARADVLTFTGPVLLQPLEVVGAPVVELVHTTDNPHADLFVRLCEVDAKGRSRNVSEAFRRLDPQAASGVVRLELDACAHRFAPGTRLRLQVAGGSHPHWARNLGTGEHPATGSAMKPSHRTIAHGTGGVSRLLLPVTSG
ncbi:CocE/NonD family hydrolase [Geodermatophilus sp. URMC 64]